MLIWIVIEQDAMSRLWGWRVIRGREFDANANVELDKSGYVYGSIEDAIQNASEAAIATSEGI
jgi:hypothetical protein